MTILDFSLGQLGGSQSIAFIPSKLPPHTHQVVGNITPYGAADALSDDLTNRFRRQLLFIPVLIRI